MRNLIRLYFQLKFAAPNLQRIKLRKKRESMKCHLRNVEYDLKFESTLQIPICQQILNLVNRNYLSQRITSKTVVGGTRSDQVNLLDLDFSDWPRLRQIQSGLFFLQAGITVFISQRALGAKILDRLFFKLTKMLSDSMKPI